MFVPCELDDAFVTNEDPFMEFVATYSLSRSRPPIRAGFAIGAGVAPIFLGMEESAGVGIELFAIFSVAGIVEFANPSSPAFNSEI